MPQQLISSETNRDLRHIRFKPPKKKKKKKNCKWKIVLHIQGPKILLRVNKIEWKISILPVVVVKIGEKVLELKKTHKNK